MWDPPYIVNAERWGREKAQERALFCKSCGEVIFAGEMFYCLAGIPYCEGCVSAMNGCELLRKLGYTPDIAEKAKLGQLCGQKNEEADAYG